MSLKATKIDAGNSARPKMSSRKRQYETNLSLRLTKRNGRDAGAKNPLLKLIPDVKVESDVSKYTEHKQWESLESDGSCMLVFEKWYNDNNKRYKHIKHAFNSLCKHYGLIEIRHVTISIDGEELSTLWAMKSFHDRTWIYQVVEGGLNQVAFQEGSVFSLKDEELEPIAKLIETVCA